MAQLHKLQIEPIVSRALEEDWGYGDWTTDLCVAPDTISRARLIAKEDLVVAGREVVETVFEIVDQRMELSFKADNGDEVVKGEEIFVVEGPARSILRAERVALNFFGRLSGVATMARAFARQLEGTKTQLLDTRKTIPGMRILEKSATVIGGARNHRFGLCDGVIVKENHIRAAGSIKAAVEKLLESLPPTLKIEVETTNLNEVQEALDAGADIIMLDNMSISEMSLAVRTVRGRALLEASGNVTLENVGRIAESGVDFISTSACIHSSRWSDISLLFDS